MLLSYPFRSFFLSVTWANARTVSRRTGTSHKSDDSVGDAPGANSRKSVVGPHTLNFVSLPALQQPQWPDRDRLDAVARSLEALPPLVLAAECDQLKGRLAAVARGEAFLLQGGDCAETFAGSTADSIRGKFQT
ncbi:3-deoxy-7-phosphoheptulonate synthase, partial [Acetobacter fabarum]|uniref:3-deoxy-7-phosphoheptulonate synthase n=1 Tax=Acetobacter fabarum TaxID=483199 RepID=UPI00211D933F